MAQASRLCPLWGTGDTCWDPITLGQSRYSALVCVTALCALLLKPRCFGAHQLCCPELAQSPLAPRVIVTLSCWPLPGIRRLPSAQITPLQHAAPLPQRQQKSLSLKTNNLATVTHVPQAEHLHVNELPLGPKQVLLLLKNDKSTLFLLSPCMGTCLLV